MIDLLYFCKSGIQKWVNPYISCKSKYLFYLDYYFMRQADIQPNAKTFNVDFDGDVDVDDANGMQKVKKHFGEEKKRYAKRTFSSPNKMCQAGLATLWGESGENL